MPRRQKSQVPKSSQVPESCFANVNGVRLHYLVAGKGDPIVLLHGYAETSNMWLPLIPRLANTHTVIAPDLRGFGQSPSMDPFTMESLGDDVHELLVELNVLPCVLAGLSMGGYVAISYALKYAKDLCGLILADTRAAADEQRATAPAIRRTAFRPPGGPGCAARSSARRRS